MCERQSHRVYCGGSSTFLGRGEGGHCQHSVLQGNGARSLPHAQGCCVPSPTHLCPLWLLWSRLGHPTPKGAPKAPGEMNSPKSSSAGVSGALSHPCCPQPHWQPRWDNDTPAGGLGGDSSAGRSQLAEDQALVVGWHVHLAAQSRGSGGPRGTGSSPGPLTHHPLQAQPVGLGQVPQQRRVPQPPGGIAAGGRCGSHMGHRAPKPPQNRPISGGCPREWLILEDHAGRELPAAAGVGEGWRGQDGPPGTSSYLCLRLRSKSTLLWGVMWPSTA